jgi:hypothetical protein
MPAQARLALRWVARASRPLTDLLDPVVMRAALEAVRLKQDGMVGAAETQRHSRKTLVNAVRYAVEVGRLDRDPMAGVNLRALRTVKEVDPRVVVNPAQALHRRLPARAGPTAGGVVRRHVLRRAAARRSGRGSFARLCPALHGLGQGDPAPYPASSRPEVDRYRAHA